MIFSNFFEDSLGLEIKRQGKNAFPLKVYPERIKQGITVIKDNCLQVVDGNAEDDLFTKSIRDVIKKSPEVLETELLKGVTVGEVLADTEDNPIITVLAKSVSFFANVPTVISYVNMGAKGVLVQLLAGACSFTFPNIGARAPLERCNLVDTTNRNESEDYTGSKITELADTVDTESNYNFKSECVRTVLVNVGADGSIRSRVLKDWSYIFDDTQINAHRVSTQKSKQAEKDRKYLLEVQRKQAEAEDRRIREAKKAEEEAIALEKEKAKQAKKSKFIEMPEDDSNGRSAGADMFLNIVRGS